MARPTRTNAEFFYHPATFRNDRRVKAIRARYGAAGYGLLLMLIELLTDADNIELATDEMELELLAGDLSVPVEEVAALIQLAEKVGLFSRNEAGQLKCPQLDEWLLPVFDKRNRARAAALDGKKSNAPWAKHTDEVFARDGHKCKHCHSSNDLTLDHIIPRAAGGSDEITNLQTLCSRCNSAKGVNLSQPVTVIPPVQERTEQENTVQNNLPSPRVGAGEGVGVGRIEKKIGAAENSGSVPAAAHAQPPVAAAPLPSPVGAGWPPPDPALPHPGVKLPFASAEFAQVWGQWRQVAAERGAAYPGAISEQNSLMELTRLSGVGNEPEALAILRQALKHQTWKNFYPLKPDAPQPTIIRTNRLSGADSSQRNKIGNPSFANDVA